MNSAGENPRLGWRAEGLRPTHRSNIHAAPKRVEEPRARLILPGKSNRGCRPAERSHVVCGVARPSRHDFSGVVIQDEHRCLARDSRDIAVNELVDDQVAKHRDAYRTEPINQFEQPCRAGHQWLRRSHQEARRIQETASMRLSTIAAGFTRSCGARSSVFPYP